MSEKKTDLITGIQCPNCGKVCPLGTTECPNCHHKLPQPKVTMVRTKLSTKNNTRLVRLVAGILIIGCALYMIINLLTNTTPRIYSPYIPVKMTYYDQHQKPLFADYYVTKQKTTENNYHFTMAYLGRNEKGKAKVRNVDVTVLRAHYKKNPHYQLTIKKKQIYLSGPNQVQINVTRKTVNQAQTGTATSFPTLKHLKCIDSHNELVSDVSLLAISTPTN